MKRRKKLLKNMSNLSKSFLILKKNNLKLNEKFNVRDKKWF